MTIYSVLGASLLVTASLALAQAPASSAGTPTKVAVIDVQSAIVATSDGKKAAADLQAKFVPKKNELDKKQSDIAALQGSLSKSNVMSDEAKQKIMRDIDKKTTDLKRDTEDANAELEQEQGRVMNDLGGKLMSVVNKYAADNGFALVLDISNQQSGVLFASNTIDITREIVSLYDKAAPMTPSAAKPATGSAASTTPAPRPAAPVRRPVTPK